ncbi:hypothetical protein DPMN_118979 [Dreissena polymorpha]|uniref:Uncharacterized protein n=1 Tax=Dreissena polymorpha TaxID=45954 RepID=A0A9D4JQT5_DREPO|nr:hypothetical protein DPMN_118979 [Dreissena polymorpha]
MKWEFHNIGHRPSIVDRNNCREDQDSEAEGGNEIETDVGHVYNYRQQMHASLAPSVDGVYRRLAVRRNTRLVPKIPPFMGKDWTAKFKAIAEGMVGTKDDKLKFLFADNRRSGKQIWVFTDAYGSVV